MAGVAEPEPISEALTAFDQEIAVCPKCGGRMWDNRLTKRNPKAPDFKCRDRTCDGVIWPPRPTPSASATGSRGAADAVPDLPLAADEIPF